MSDNNNQNAEAPKRMSLQAQLRETRERRMKQRQERQPPAGAAVAEPARPKNKKRSRNSRARKADGQRARPQMHAIRPPPPNQNPAHPRQPAPAPRGQHVESDQDMARLLQENERKQQAPPPATSSNISIDINQNNTGANSSSISLSHQGGPQGTQTVIRLNNSNNTDNDAALAQHLNEKYQQEFQDHQERQRQQARRRAQEDEALARRLQLANEAGVSLGADALRPSGDVVVVSDDEEEEDDDDSSGLDFNLQGNPPAPANVESDEDLARRLQQEEYAPASRVIRRAVSAPRPDIASLFPASAPLMRPNLHNRMIRPSAFAESDSDDDDDADPFNDPFFGGMGLPSMFGAQAVNPAGPRMGGMPLFGAQAVNPNAMLADLRRLMAAGPMLGGGAGPGLAAFGGLNLDRMDHDQLMALSERIGQVRNRGASQSNIDNLPTRTMKVEEKKDSTEEKKTDQQAQSNAQKNCTICLEDWADKDEVRTLPCLHIFHSKCVDKWLRQNRTCPVCKHDISSNS